MQNYFDNEATSSALHATMKPARGGKCLVTLSTYEDRKEALLNTTIMDDAGIYRSMGTKNITTSQIDRHKNDTLDSRESKQEAHSHIPKPPPLQMNSNSNQHEGNNRTQTISNAKVGNKSLVINDTSSTARLSNSSQNSNSNFYSGNETGSKAGKTSSSSLSPSSPAASNNLNGNRQTLRLGTVTIGEYHQPSMRKEPEKFNFISAPSRHRDTMPGDITPTNEALQSELQSTLTRANLRKSNGNSYTEHQRNCPLHQQQQQQQQLQQRPSLEYGNNGFAVEEVTKKLQKSSFNENNSSEMLTKASNRSAKHTNGSTGVGILKNGNRTGTSSSSKSVEKSIKFG